jgi:hypothetical protein
MILSGRQFLFSIILITGCIYLFGCGDDIVKGATNLPLPPDPTILQTDDFGFILGGDTTDWCYHSSGQFTFGPAYPNPTIDTFKLHFTVTVSDTMSLYFLNSETDTLFLINRQPLSVGFYEISASSQSLNYERIVKRLYVRTTHTNNGPFCRYYGDIQFY